MSAPFGRFPRWKTLKTMSASVLHSEIGFRAAVRPQRAFPALDSNALKLRSESAEVKGAERWCAQFARGGARLYRAAAGKCSILREEVLHRSDRIGFANSLNGSHDGSGKRRISSRTLPRMPSSASASSRLLSASANKSETSSISSSFIPRVVTAGVPTRMPPGLKIG